MKGVLLLLFSILYDLWLKQYGYVMREHEKGYQKAVATMNIKTSIFNLQYLCHFCMDFYATIDQKRCKNTFPMIYYTYL